MDSHNTGLATLAGGCFWCLEAVYEQVQGVDKVVSGYTGGHLVNPTYRQVCSETTGHAEAVQVTYDPQIISHKDILDIFFAIHDPTTLNRQGNDIGESYRSAIFYHSPEQKEAAETEIARLNAADIWNDPIVTEVNSFDVFYVAEPEHQQYFRNNTFQPYCQYIISPKVAKFRKEHLDKLKPTVTS
jgi:peptide-methionine (S)-S-oxide reductase